MALQNIDPPDPLIGTLVSGRYRVVSKLGEGGMGRVYEAQHELIGKRVALKCLNAEYATHPVVVERFKREARAATAVGNEHIVDVTDLGDLPDGSPFIVMEHLEGRELADLINEGPLTLGRAVRILDQVCDALHAAHAKGIVHRDLKPENIFLIPRGGNEDFVKVLDFGISKMREPEETSPSLTRTGMAMGTPQYMSPEQAQGKMSTDHRTDVYALGGDPLPHAHGEVPFTAESFPMLIVAIVTQDAPSVLLLRPELPGAMDGIVRRALARDVDERFQTVQELALALAPFRHVEEPPRRGVVVPKTRLSLEGTVPGKLAPKRPADPEGRPSAAPTVGGIAPAGLASASGPNPRTEGAAPVATSDSSHATSRGEVTGVENAITRGPTWLRPAVVLSIVLGVVALLFWLRQPVEPVPNPRGDRTPDAVIDAPPVPPAPDEDAPPPLAAASPEVRVRLSVLPAGARIFLDDREFPNPLDSPRPRSLEPVRVRMELEGYDTIERMIVFDSDARLEITLVPTAGRPQGGTTGASTTSSMRIGADPTPPPSGTMMEASSTPMDGFRDTFD
ncbi:MAG: protein kinase [Sandaracinaceae bacterium]|nr:protein kinase [Sandaracinaceae bacterium]